MLWYSYLGPDVLGGFDNYKYSAKDTSPLSNYVCHPFWNRVVKLCPRWVAPNLLTLVGFICCVGHNALTAVYDYNYDANCLPRADHDPIPGFVWFFVAVLLFLSHTLDGIDGKQARRTGTSSPLGELFDHGCDAWATVFICGTFYSVFGRNYDGYSISELRMYTILWSIFLSFHMSHWEKYLTGVMYLPWSYDISMLGGTILYLITSFAGYELWKYKLPGEMSCGPIMEAMIYIGIYFLSFPLTLWHIRDSYRERTGKMRSFFEAVRPLVSFFLAMAACLAWAIYSPNDVFHNDVRCFFYMSGTLYANMSCRLIVAQMSNSRCELINYLLYPLLAAVALSLALPGLGFGLAGELFLLYGLSLLATAVHLHYGACVVRQMCDHFRIEAFRIPGGDKRGEHRLLPTEAPKDADDDNVDESESGDEDSGVGRENLYPLP